jgi:7-cyano-7-deazaguanine synthase in queuosine biosynthesis
MQKAKLVGDHFKMLIERGLITRHFLIPFQAGAFVRNGRLKREFDVRLREVTHRCRPLLFLVVAGLVADSLSAKVVEVFESGVGSVNLPLVGGPADFRTTRSTHPQFLRLISELLGHVNEATVQYILPFADRTKAEMTARLRELGMEELARKSISCILHPLSRRGWQQCGYCPACVYRRQALISAGIEEAHDAYAVDLFAAPDPHHAIPAKQMRWIRAFYQQVARLSDLDSGRTPEPFRRYLRATRAISSDDQLPPHVEVYRRYRQEWLALIADAQRRGLPWVSPARSPALALGATP